VLLSVDGRSVFASTGGRSGESSLPLLLLVHGAGMDHTTWVLQARFLAHHGYRVLAVDLPGHGRSDGPPPASIEKAAEWLLQLVAAAGATTASVIGHSMGAAIALTAAALGGDTVGRLALLGAARRFPVHPDLLAAAKAGADLAPRLMAFWGLGSHAQLGGHVAPGLWLKEATQRLIEQGLHRSLASDLAACAAWRAEPWAGKIRSPTLVLSASEDRMTPAREGRALAEMIPGARLEILAGAGHMMMLEQPDQTLDRLALFLERETVA
jgi:pimeloyl-ACP methyl ester carboxylesterase